MSNMTKELFVESINDAMKADMFNEEYNKFMRNNGADGYTFFPTCVDTVIKLLHNAMLPHDQEDWISYFCFELDYGRNWKPGTIIEKDGTDIVISTPERLYDYLLTQ